MSHDPSVVGRVSDPVAVMYVGKTVELASTEDLFNAPKRPYTKALLSAVPKPDPRLRNEGTRIRLEGEVADSALAIYLRLDAFSLPALHNFGTLALGLLWLGFILFVEAHMRGGVARKDLWRRAVYVLTVGVYVLELFLRAEVSLAVQSFTEVSRCAFTS